MGQDTHHSCWHTKSRKVILSIVPVKSLQMYHMNTEEYFSSPQSHRILKSQIPRVTDTQACGALQQVKFHKAK